MRCSRVGAIPLRRSQRKLVGRQGLVAFGHRFATALPASHLRFAVMGRQGLASFARAVGLSALRCPISAALRQTYGSNPSRIKQKFTSSRFGGPTGIRTQNQRIMSPLL